MPTGQGTSADAELIHRLKKRGITVTVRQLQDWRRMGLIASPDVKWNGRHGSETLGYPDGTDDQVARVALVLAKDRNMDRAVLGLFGVGVTPTGKALFSAYRGFVDAQESDDLENLALANAGDKRFAKRARAFEARVAKDVPEIGAHWHASAKAKASAESQEIDHATGKARRVRPQEIKERDAEQWLLSRIGEDGGDATPFLKSFGLRDDVLQGIDTDGGYPTFAELRRALDETPYADLVWLRDQMIASWEEFATDQLPDSMAEFFQTRMDEPATFGMTVAAGVLAAHVVRIRTIESSEDD